MNKSDSDQEESRKITVDSKAIAFFFAFILLEGYILISASLGVFPFAITDVFPYEMIVASLEGLYALYWIGILCLIIGLLVGRYNKLYPPIVLIGSLIFFIVFIM